MSAVCFEPSSRMMWWISLSLFLKTTCCDDASMVAGFGLKAWVPPPPVMLIVTVDVPGTGEGPVDDPPPPPQLRVSRAPTSAADPIIRISVGPPERWPRLQQQGEYLG